MNKHTKKVLSFVILTYIITILFYIMLQLNGGKSNPITFNLIGISMAFPLFSVVIVQKCIFKQSLKDSLGISFKFNGWYVISILIPIIMAICINLISINQFKINIFSLKTFVTNIIVGLTIASISALLEELAWRGFLFNELKALGMFKTSILIGIIWSLWHTPVTVLYKYPSSPFTGSIINFFQMFVISIIITYIRDKSGSVFAAAIIHGMFNTTILSSSMDSFEIVLIKVLLGIFIITVLFIHDYRNKRTHIKLAESER